MYLTMLWGMQAKWTSGEIWALKKLNTLFQIRTQKLRLQLFIPLHLILSPSGQDLLTRVLCCWRVILKSVSSLWTMLSSHWHTQEACSWDSTWKAKEKFNSASFHWMSPHKPYAWIGNYNENMVSQGHNFENYFRDIHEFLELKGTQVWSKLSRILYKNVTTYNIHETSSLRAS